MSTHVTPHLNFRGNAREVLEHYRTVFGGQLMIATYADLPGAPDVTAAEADQVVFGQVANEQGFTIMAFDVPSARPWDPGQAAYFVSVRVTEADELTAYWDRLVEGSTVLTPIGPSAWSPLYGMLTDRFGVTWVLDLQVAHAG